LPSHPELLLPAVLDRHRRRQAQLGGSELLGALLGSSHASLPLVAQPTQLVCQAGSMCPGPATCLSKKTSSKPRTGMGMRLCRRRFPQKPTAVPPVSHPSPPTLEGLRCRVGPQLPKLERNRGPVCFRRDPGIPHSPHPRSQARALPEVSLTRRRSALCSLFEPLNRNPGLVLATWHRDLRCGCHSRFIDL